MCRTCGCSDQTQATLTDLQDGMKVAVYPDSMDPDHHHHDHEHAHFHTHEHSHEDIHHVHEHASGPGDPEHSRSRSRIFKLEQQLLAKNQLLAERNRGWLAGRNIIALNLISSPGSGKTTLLERTIRGLADKLPISVIEGDQATLNDAERIQATGCKVVQINTGAGCHLEAAMTARGLAQLNPPLNSLVMIENVGNLVCPALFDLGELAKVVIMSVTDGEDKPIKYPHAFRASQLMILNKVDLLPYLQFDVERCLEYARRVNPRLNVLQLSATRGDGLEEWYGWLREQRRLRNTTESVVGP